MDLMQRRRELLMGAGSLLPSAYRQLEYIQSSGGAYIDTGVAITVDLVLEMTIKVPTPTASRYIVGKYSSIGTFYIYETSGIKYQTAYGCSYKNSTNTIDSDKHVLKYEIENGNTFAYLDGNVLVQNSANETMPSQSIIVAGTAESSAQAVNTYSVKMIRNGAKILDFIPCVRKSDSEPGMYDTISKIFYTNAGTGAFIVPA